MGRALTASSRRRRQPEPCGWHEVVVFHVDVHPVGVDPGPSSRSWLASRADRMLGRSQPHAGEPIDAYRRRSRARKHRSVPSRAATAGRRGQAPAQVTAISTQAAPASSTSSSLLRRHTSSTTAGVSPREGSTSRSDHPAGTGRVERGGQHSRWTRPSAAVGGGGWRRHRASGAGAAAQTGAGHVDEHPVGRRSRRRPRPRRRVARRRSRPPGARW